MLTDRERFVVSVLDRLIAMDHEGGLSEPFRAGLATAKRLIENEARVEDDQDEQAQRWQEATA